MPFFRYPKTDAERGYFMQKNDVFIEVFVVVTNVIDVMNTFIHHLPYYSMFTFVSD